MSKCFKSLLLAVVITGFIFGCSRKGSGPAGDSARDHLKAVISTNANIYCEMAIKDSRSTPWSAYSTAQTAEAGANILQENLTRYTGIKPEEMEFLIICLKSADTGYATVMEQLRPGTLPAADGSMGLRLINPVTLSALKTSMLSSSNSSAGIKAEDITVNGTPAIKAVLSGDTNAALFASVGDGGKTIFVSLNETSHAATLARSSGTSEPLPQEILSEINKMPAGAQVKAVILIPESGRISIREQIAKSQKETGKQPGLGFGAGILKPFQNIRSIGLSVATSTNMNMSIYGNLGADKEADQAASLLQSIVIPMLSMLMSVESQKSGTPAIDINELISASATGSTLRISMNLNTNDIAILGKLDFEKMIPAQKAKQK